MNLFPRRWQGILFAILCIALFSWSCTTIPQETRLAEPYAYFNTQPQLYARFSSQAFRQILTVLDATDFGYNLPALKSMDDFLGRSRVLGAGISGLGTDKPQAEAVALGDFQVFSIRLAVAASGEWARKPDGGYRSVLYPVEITPPQPGILHLVSTDQKNTVAKASPILAFPPGYSSLSGSDIFISINSPSALLAKQLPFDSFTLPVSAILLSGNSLPGTDSQKYGVEVRFVMKDESTARSFRPVVKILWASAAQLLFGNSIDSAKTELLLSGDTYTAGGIVMDAAGVTALLVRAASFY